MKTYLVTGAAGFIGSFVARALLEQGHQVVTIDNLSTGKREVVPEGCIFIEGDDFVYLNKRSLSSRYLERSLNAWIESLNEEERQRFTQIIFGELNKFEAEDITVFFKKLFFQVKPVYKAYRKLNKEDKELVNRVIKKLIKNLIKADKPKQIAA